MATRKPAAAPPVRAMFKGLTGIDTIFVITLSVIAVAVFAGYLLR